MYLLRCMRGINCRYLSAWLKCDKSARFCIRHYTHLVAVILLCVLAPQLAFGDLGQAQLIEGWERLENCFEGFRDREQKQGTVRISHIGDSHIIADFWTGEMRQKLQERFGDGGRGFVLGGEMWRSYGQRHIWHYTEGEWTVTNLKRGRDTGVFGPGGAALICDKLDCLTGVETREKQWAARFDTLDIFTLGSGLGTYYNLYIDQKLYDTINNFSPWLGIHRHRVHLPLSHHKVQVSPSHDQSELWLFGFSLQNSQGGLIYDSIGLNGSQAKHLLKNTDRSLQSIVKLLKSHLLVISFGINEIFDRGYDRSDYAKNLDLLLSILRDPTLEYSDRFDCLLTGPFAALKRGSPPPELDEVYQIQRTLSNKYGCAFWDAREAMGGSIRPWQKRKRARKDGVHLSRQGYQRIATLFEESLMLSYHQWLSAKAKFQQAPQMQSPP